LIISETKALRMVKAVFFDWFNTLARLDPPREELYHQAFLKFGIGPPFKDIVRGVMAADRYYFEENTRSPLAKRSQEEQMKVYLHYPMAILAEAGLEAPQDVLMKVLMIVVEVHIGDQYELDVAGARGVGITPILIDRYEIYPEVSDCPRIRSLRELAKYL